MMNCWCDQCVTRRVMLQTKVSPGILLLTELLVPLTNVFSNSFSRCVARPSRGVSIAYGRNLLLYMEITPQGPTTYFVPPGYPTFILTLYMRPGGRRAAGRGAW